jgi:tetratricopeptide (TPR) repeat protein
MLARPALDARSPLLRPPDARVSLDRTKILEQAQKHHQKGAWDKAILEYQKLVKDDPQDVRTWLKIGDLFARKGSNKEAVDTYARVAETYAQQGFFLKAVAVYKQILKLDPSSIDTQVKLAGMYEHLALVSDALAMYEQVAAIYARGGQIERTLQTLAKMVELDPGNIPVRIKLAESLSKAGKTKEAADEFEAGAKLLREQGRIDDYIKVGERLLFHRADDVALARDLAGLYLERGDAKRALGKLQGCFKADPKDVVTLELLGQAFLGLQQQQKTVSVFKEIARIHLDAGRRDERLRMLRRIIELDPGDQEARQGLAAAGAPGSVATDAAPRGAIAAPPPTAVVQAAPAARAPSPPAAEPRAAPPAAPPAGPRMTTGVGPAPVTVTRQADRPPPPAEADEELEAADEDILIEDDDAVSDSPEAAAEAEAARQAQVARLLNECDVFQRYGLKQKVMEQLQKLLVIQPTHIEARERLKNAFLEARRTDDAVRELRVLAEMLLDEQPDLAVVYLRQLVELVPNDEDALDKLSILTDDDLAASAPTEDRFSSVEDVGDIVPGPESQAPPPPTGELGDDDSVMFVEDEQMVPAPATLSTVDRSFVPTLEDPDALGPATVFEHRLEDETGHDLQLPGVVVASPTSAASATSSAAAELPPAEDEDALEPMSPAEFEALRPSSPDGFVVPRPSLRPGASAADIEEVLDEAEFYVAQGLFDEARATLQDTLASHPGHPLVAEKLQEIEEAAAAHAQALASVPPPTAEDEAFQLAERLAQELGPAEEQTANGDILDVDQVFAQFKKGVAEQIGLEDSDTHFDLGIAYKEMGLLEDAVHEFELAMSNPQKECLAHTMVGLCFVEKGDIAEAVSHFKKGLYCDTKTDREELGLYFELGVAYELLHDPKEALYYFQKVQKRDPGFRNVPARIRALAQPRIAAPPPPAKAGGPDDVDRAFDDLMGDGEKR